MRKTSREAPGSSPERFPDALSARRLPPLRPLRQSLAAFGKRLHLALREGIPTAQLLQARSQLLDRLLQTLWRRLALEDGALIAVGGYGARELFPHSDIDLLILTEEPSVDDHRLALFLQFLWDLGLRVGHSVRTVPECLDWARRDQTVMTNLLTRRLLAGRKDLWRALSEGLHRLWSFEAFYRAKLAEQQERHRRTLDHAFAVEPHLKEGLGGLRDLQLLHWLLQFRFGRGDWELLVEGGLLDRELLERLIQAETFLKRLRFALHLAAGRNEEILRFEYQKTVAGWLGFRGRGNAPAEAMMETCFRAMRQVVRFGDLILAWLDPAPGEGRQNIDLDFEIRGHYLALKRPNRLWERPALALQLFRQGQRFSELRGPAPETLKELFFLLEEPSWGHRLRRDPQANALFLEILSAGEGVARQLFAMHRSGLLSVLLPPFGFLTGKMQFDLFHRHPVDEHLLKTVLELRHIAQARYRKELPLAHDLFSEISRPDLLILAALFHDIGKGYGRDHTLVGEEIWRALSRRFDLSSQESDLVAWLIRNHLLLSTTAQKEDLSDPEVVARFARKVEDAERLKYLYLLTVADVRATNPTLWNGWREALFRELFLAARKLLGRKFPITVDRQRIIEEQRQRAKRKLAELGISEEAAESVWRPLPRDYFVSLSVDGLVWQTLEMVGAEDFPHVAYWPETPHGNDEIFIYTPDRPQLFAQIAAILARLGLNILRADLYTSRRGVAVDRFQVVELGGGNILDWQRQQRICHQLKRCLKHPSERCFAIRRSQPKVDRTLFPPKLTFRQAGALTRLEIVAADRPGLLSDIGRVFAKLGLNLSRAQVVTLGMRVEDIFDLSNATHAPLSPAEQERLKAELEAVL